MPRAKSGLSRGSQPIKGQPVSAPAPLGAPAPVGVPMPTRKAGPRARPGPAGRFLATTSVRVAAYFTDSVMLSLLAFALWMAVGSATGTEPTDGASTSTGQPVGRLLSLVVSYGMSAAYFITLWSGGRRTLGMRLFRLEVVRATDGGNVGIPAAALRWAVIVVPDVLLGFVDFSILGSGVGELVGFTSAWGWTIVLLLSVHLSATGQGLHDRAAGTSVVTR